jgi:hypothetical protein
LQKLASREYEKITGKAEDGEYYSGDEDDERRKKPQSLSKVLKNRLQKLVNKTDERWDF